MSISQKVLDEINAAEDALTEAVAGDAQAANDLANVHSAQATADGSQSSALLLHSKATGLAQQALLDLRNELQLPGWPTPTPSAVRGESPGDRDMGTGFATNRSQWPAPSQHPLITRALNLGINWGPILQALIEGGLAALQQLIDQAVKTK